jgi:magnesium chelatase subunit D
VLLTDGRPNLCRDGRHGREAAEADAVAAAATLRHDGIASLLIDTSTRPDRGPARIAEAMGAEYVPLPFADAQSVSAEVRVRLGR